MPKLWNETIATHRETVRDAITESAAKLATIHGLASVTMSAIAESAGVGRATLYKYFPDVDAILIAWHEQHISAHLRHLTAIRDGARSAGERLRAVLEAYALIAHERHDAELSAFLHRGEHVARAQQHLNDFVRDLIADAAAAGEVRGDVEPQELAAYCLHALSAAGGLPSKAAVRRLVEVTVTGLRP